MFNKIGIVFLVGSLFATTAGGIYLYLENRRIRKSLELACTVGEIFASALESQVTKTEQQKESENKEGQ